MSATRPPPLVPPRKGEGKSASDINLHGTWALRSADGRHACAYAVPGDVHSALIAARIIPDPYVGRNEYDVRWVAEADWIAAREFEWNGEGAWHLDADYLDTVTEVKINGKSVLKADNCFRRYTPDVTKALKKGRNQIEIRFFSNNAEARKRQKAHPYFVPYAAQNCPIPDTNFLRKPSCHAGWDWNLAIMPFGAYGRLKLAASRPNPLNVSASQKHLANGDVEIAFSVSSYDPENRGRDLEIACGSVKKRVVFSGRNSNSGFFHATDSIVLRKPKLWWPAGSGEQNLIDVSVTSGTNVWQQRIGLRQIDLINEKDAVGSRFAFRVNGREIFCRGANWIPADALPSRATPELTRKGGARRRGRVLAHPRPGVSAHVDPHADGGGDPASHRHLERLPVRRGLRGPAELPDDGETQQHLHLHHGREGIQCGNGGDDADGRRAPPHLFPFRQIFCSRHRRWRSERITMATATSTKASSVSIQNLAQSYGSLQVLKELSLEIPDGEFLVLLGPSGCGKSTLLNCIAGLLEPTQGKIFIKGRNVTWEEPSKRGIGMVFQSYALYPQMTVERNLSFGLRVAGMAKDEIAARVKRASEILQIEPLLQRKPMQLSGGQRQRVAIGRALVRDVDVFLFDEPLSNLDAKLRAELRVEIKRLHQRLGNTMIYVTHDQIEAMTLADRIAVMKGGSIQQLDAPLTIYSKPKNRYVAGFIGSPSMNFIKAKIGGTTKAPTVEVSGQTLDISDYQFSGPTPLGREVEFGARPEHINILRGAAAKGKNVFSATIELVEPMGSDSLVWLELGSQKLSARVESSEKFTPGEKVAVQFRVDQASVFDLQSGDRL